MNEYFKNWKSPDYYKAITAKKFLENKLGITITNPRVGLFHFEADFEPRYDAEKNEITVGSSWIGFKEKPIDWENGPKGS